MFTNLLSLSDLSLCNNDNLAVFLKRHNFSDAVRVARVIDVACRSTGHGCINNKVIINSEHVNSTVLQIIPFTRPTEILFSNVCQCLFNKSNNMAGDMQVYEISVDCTIWLKMLNLRDICTKNVYWCQQYNWWKSNVNMPHERSNRTYLMAIGMLAQLPLLCKRIVKNDIWRVINFT